MAVSVDGSACPVISLPGKTEDHNMDRINTQRGSFRRVVDQISSHATGVFEEQTIESALK